MAEFKNPNQGSGQSNSSLLVAMIVMVGVLFGVRWYAAKNGIQPGTPPAQTPSAQSAPAVAGSTGSPASASATPAVATAAPNAPKPVNVVQAAAEQTTTVENELYKITFTNRGGQVTSWVLKRFADNHGKLLDLVHGPTAAKFGFPLSLHTYDEGTNTKLKQALYVASATGTISAPGTLTFTLDDGVTAVTKTFTFDATYVVHADTKVTVNGATLRALLAWPAGFGDQENAQHFASDQLDTNQGGKVEHVASKKVAAGATLNGPFDWVGVSDMYFAAAFLPDSPATATVVTFNNAADIAKDETKPDAKISVPVLGAAIGDTSGETKTRIYAGPKVVSVLKSVHATGTSETLEPLVDFGFFGPIAKGLFYALHWIHDTLASNWGWTIVLFTVIINLLMLPLRIKTMQSGLKMQRIQPQLDAVKAKYAKYKVTDPKRNEMNAEMMQVQKEHGVNMFGGCIPTLLTFPLLFAMFGMLPKVVELRQAHWYWLHDLTAADPYHILPIIMIASQFLVQFYTPSPGVDPAQQKMMAFMMPAFSGYMTWNYASGLALYWSVGNLIMITQQMVMNQTALGKEMRALALKRAAKKKGPTTIAGRR